VNRVGMLWGTDGKMKGTWFMEGRSLIRRVEREGETDNGKQSPKPYTLVSVVRVRDLP